MVLVFVPFQCHVMWYSWPGASFLQPTIFAFSGSFDTCIDPPCKSRAKRKNYLFIMVPCITNKFILMLKIYNIKNFRCHCQRSIKSGSIPTTGAVSTRSHISINLLHQESYLYQLNHRTFLVSPPRVVLLNLTDFLHRVKWWIQIRNK